MSSSYLIESEDNDRSNRIESDEERVTIIVNQFFEMAKRVAQSRIDPIFRSLISRSSLANSGIRDVALKVACEQSADYSEDDIKNLLRKIIRNKYIDRTRRYTTLKRDIRRTVSLSFDSQGSSDSDPYARAVANELLENILSALEELHKDKVWFRIAVLGVLMKMSAEKIQEVVQNEFPTASVPKIRNMQRKIKRTHEELKRRFLPEEGGHDEQ